jgi:hypothetical protein
VACRLKLRRRTHGQRPRTSRGPYAVVNYGVRPVGAVAGGALAATIGVRPTLFIVTAGAVLKTPLRLAKPPKTNSKGGVWGG